MDTRMIEVALGLALVFAITSLLVTAIRELWASVWSSRGRHLQRALTSFVGDDKDFAEKLMKHPLLLSLSKQTMEKKLAPSIQPSYMGADIVVTALIAQLVERCAGGVRPASPVQFLSAVEAAQGTGAAPPAGLPNSTLTKGMTSLIHGVENDWPGYQARMCAWYDSVTERSIGWFKRYNQMSLMLFGVVVAAAANINPIVIAERLWQDAALRAAVAHVAQRAGEEYAAGKAAPANPVAPRGAASAPVGAPQKRNEKVDETERRLEAMRSDLDSAAARLRTHPTTGVWQGVADAQNHLLAIRGALDIARQPDDQTYGASRRHAQAMKQMERGMEGLQVAAKTAGSGHGSLQNLYAELDKALSAERRLLEQARRTEASPRAECTASMGEEARDLCDRLDDLNNLKALGLPLGWNPPVIPTVFAKQCASRSNADAVLCAGSKWGDWLLVVLGWLITAVAASLGAPFWFDALGKLAKLRGSGPRPSDVDDRGVTSTPPGGTTMSGPAGLRGGGGGAGGLPLGRGTLSPSGRQPMSDALNADEKGLASSEVARIQRALRMSEALVSGALDGATRQAIKTWQDSRGYSATAELTAWEIRELLDAQADQGAVGFVADPAKETALVPARDAVALDNVDVRSGPGAMWSRIAVVKTGEPLRVAAVVQGDELLGSSTWLRLTGDQRYVWSGAVRVIEPSTFAPAPSAFAPVVKRRTNGTILPLTPKEIDTLYGPITTAPGSPQGAVEITSPSGWTRTNLVPLKHPFIQRISNSELPVHIRALPHFIAALEAIEVAGLGDLILTCGGTFVPRHIGWNTSKPLSSHTWGIAIDLNAQWNAYGQQPALTGQKGCLRELVPFFAAEGFAWGGDFTSGADGMHFELARTNS